MKKKSTTSTTIGKWRYAACALLGFVGWHSLPASAATVYLNDFQGTVGSAWTTTAASGIHTASAPNPDYNNTRLFLGEYGNDTLTLSLGALPVHATATVSFSLYLIRSWDGNDATVVNGDPLGPDHWKLALGDTTLFDKTFSNGNPAGQSYAPSPGALSCNAGYNAVYPTGTYNPMTGAAECYSLGYTFTDPINNRVNEAMDSVYNLSFTFNHSASDMVLNFSAYGLQGLADESWGLDNVKVDVSAVPVPPAVWLFGSGLLGLIGVARRKTTSDSKRTA
ncbi:MAG TPA: VPLPA-CTERM sorting domain-containing protein [Candidatus Methylomirabilis sp.]|nr:VPLPA-CTERM sorting domain-containing protein [Candidatus Methylomirabilis sp.]